MFQKLVFTLKPLQNNFKFFARSFAKPKTIPVQQQKKPVSKKISLKLTNFLSRH